MPTAASHSAEGPSVRKGPQILLVLDEDQVRAFEQALTNPYAMIQNNFVLPSRALDMLAQLRGTKPVYWMTAEGPKLRWNIEWSLPRQILAGSVTSRYHCRQTHGLHEQFKGNPSDGARFENAVTTNEDGVLVDHWGEDDSLDEGENLAVLTPSECKSNNHRAEALLEKLKAAPATFGGFPVVPPPWASLMWATDAVQNWR